MRFSDSFLDEIRARLPISAVIAPRVTWDRRKTNASRGDWWACCPFHGESTPSFHCEDHKGRYHCFGCNASGDHFRFLTELEGLSFPEAVERLAEMAGVPMPARDPEAGRRAEARASLHEVMEMAAAFFEEQLHAAGGAKARAYLRERGLSPAVQRRFRIGYAPAARNALKVFLTDKGVDPARLEACGLVVSGPDIAVSYDRFRDRIMFPILDARERVIAFGGRALGSDVPAKYLNSPETDLFHKGRVLYNFAAARRAAGRDGQVIATEGYMDVIALAGAGIDHVVAPLGTALTEEQLELLWRIADEPVLCFDGDEAGLKAAWRAADLALPLIRPGRSLRFALMPEGQDPDDLVRGSGTEAFRAVITAARPLADLVWSRETAAGNFDTPERRAALEAGLRELVGRIRDEEVRRHYQQAMRERMRAFFGSGDRRDQRPGRERRGSAQPSGRLAISESLARSGLVQGGAASPPIRECAILVGMINHPALIEEFYDQVEFLEFSHPDLTALHGAVFEALAEGETDDAAAICAVIERMGLEPALARATGLLRRTRHWPMLESAALDDARDAFAQALHLHRVSGTLHRELMSAEKLLAENPSEENYLQLLDIQKQIRDVQATEAIIEGFGVSSGRQARS